jgi:hypothetical protein
MATYTNGYSIKSQKNITKHDMIVLCNLLNANPYYTSICEFTPEGISEGGIKFNFINQPLFYKSVRLRVSHGSARGEWPIVNNNVMMEWIGNSDIILEINKQITIFLKSFHGAPLFTIEELKIWEECFGQIGLIKIGKYPSKKSLISNAM